MHCKIILKIIDFFFSKIVIFIQILIHFLNHTHARIWNTCITCLRNFFYRCKNIDLANQVNECGDIINKCNVTKMSSKVKLPGCLGVTLTLELRTCFALGSSQCWGEAWWGLWWLPQFQIPQHIQSVPRKTPGMSSV